MSINSNAEKDNSSSRIFKNQEKLLKVECYEFIFRNDLCAHASSDRN